MRAPSEGLRTEAGIQKWVLPHQLYQQIHTQVLRCVYHPNLYSLLLQLQHLTQTQAILQNGFQVAPRGSIAQFRLSRISTRKDGINTIIFLLFLYILFLLFCLDHSGSFGDLQYLCSHFKLSIEQMHIGNNLFYFGSCWSIFPDQKIQNFIFKFQILCGLQQEKSMKSCVYSESGLKRSQHVAIILYKTCILTGLTMLWAGSCLLRCLRDILRREKKWFFTQLSLLNRRKLTCQQKYVKSSSICFLASCVALIASLRPKRSTHSTSCLTGAGAKIRVFLAETGTARELAVLVLLEEEGEADLVGGAGVVHQALREVCGLSGECWGYFLWAFWENGKQGFDCFKIYYTSTPIQWHNPPLHSDVSQKAVGQSLPNIFSNHFQSKPLKMP